MIGKKAPFFKAPAVLDGKNIIENFSSENFLGKKEAILFFYPKDFTYVCPTELHALQNSLYEFQKREVEIIACSTDTVETHLAWLNTPKEKGGISGVTYPLVADHTKTISINYGVLAGDWVGDENGKIDFCGEGVSYRATFFIDKEGFIRNFFINDFPLGRSVEELIRVIDMWHHNQKLGDVCPANWKLGSKSIKPNRESVSEYLNN